MKERKTDDASFDFRRTVYRKREQTMSKHKEKDEMEVVTEKEKKDEISDLRNQV